MLIHIWLAFGLNDIGIIEIPSNGGTGKIAVNLSVEVPAPFPVSDGNLSALAVIAASLSYISGIEGLCAHVIYYFPLERGLSYQNRFFAINQFLVKIL